MEWEFVIVGLGQYQWTSGSYKILRTKGEYKFWYLLFDSNRTRQFGSLKEAQNAAAFQKGG